MIRITIFKNKSTDMIKGFHLSGHAGYAESGKDIICAAISVLSINTINSIEQFTDAQFECESDETQTFIDYRLVSDKSGQAQLLLKSLELGFKEIASDNPKYISITFEEV